MAGSQGQCPPGGHVKAEIRTPIFEKSITLSPADDKKNVYFTFRTPENISKLIIDYAYSPKTLKDENAALNLINEKLKAYGTPGNARDFLPAKNLITLSFDKNGAYIGAAHRQPEKQHLEISAGYATPGLQKCAVENADWRIALNVHCCLTEVQVHIKIQGVHS